MDIRRGDVSIAVVVVVVAVVVVVVLTVVCLMQRRTWIKLNQFSPVSVIAMVTECVCVCVCQ